MVKPLKMMIIRESDFSKISVELLYFIGAVLFISYFDIAIGVRNTRLYINYRCARGIL